MIIKFGNEETLEQLSEKYLVPEKVEHGYIVLFDPETKVGEICTPQKTHGGGKRNIGFQHRDRPIGP